MAPIAHVIVTVDLDQTYLPEFARLDDIVTRIDQVRCTAALRTNLHHPLSAAGCGQHGLPFQDINADRFLDVHIAARFNSRDHRQRMPVVGRGDQDDVEVFFGQHLTVVAIGARCLAGSLPRCNQLRRLRHHPLIHVTQRDNFHRRHLD